MQRVPVILRFHALLVGNEKTDLVHEM